MPAPRVFASFCGLTLPERVPSVCSLLTGPSWRWASAGSAAYRRGSEFELTEIRLKKGEPVEKALRRLKKKIDREGTLREVRNHRHYEKPSEKRRRKMKIARFSAMLSARYADL